MFLDDREPLTEKRPPCTLDYKKALTHLTKQDKRIKREQGAGMRKRIPQAFLRSTRALPAGGSATKVAATNARGSGG
jgi:hypothetical protein